MSSDQTKRPQSGNALPPDDERRLWLPPSARHERYAATFDADQVRALKRLGVEEEQRIRLVPALRVIRLCSETAPKLSEVRQHLEDLASNVRDAARSLQMLLAAPEAEAARFEAMHRLRQASLRIDGDGLVGEPLDQMGAALRDLVEVAEKAIRSTPAGQTRPQAHIYPIQYIDDALRIGFDITWKSVPVEERRPNPFAPSARNGSPFREVVAICYAAAGAPNSDPLRAIRGYLAALKTAAPRTD